MLLTQSFQLPSQSSHLLVQLLQGFSLRRKGRDLGFCKKNGIPYNISNKDTIPTEDEGMLKERQPKAQKWETKRFCFFAKHTVLLLERRAGTLGILQLLGDLGNTLLKFLDSRLTGLFCGYGTAYIRVHREKTTLT